MKFLGILLLLKITFKIKGGYGCIFRFVGVLFEHDYKFDYCLV